jgi:small-conductance mechanosensitive channel
MTAHWLDVEYLGNPLKLWLAAASVLVGVVVAVEIVRGLLITRLKKIVDSSETTVDNLALDLVRKVKLLGLLVLGLYFGTRLVALPGQAESLIRVVLVTGLVLQAAVWGNTVIAYLLQRQFGARGVSTTTDAGTGYGALNFILRLVLWSLLVLLALDNFGINVTTLVAGLGVGGIAIALAVQNILGDIFCSLSIVLDKPFEIGDFIIVGDLMGTIEHIGIKTTRLRSLSGEQLVFSNSDLVGSRIRNYKRMSERRIVFEFGVTYQTTADKVEKIPGIVRDILAGVDDTRLDRAHFKSYGDFALIFEVVYYVPKPDYNIYMDVQQTINLALMRRFEAEEIQFAYPTQTLYVNREAS